MKCLICENFSFNIICKACLDEIQIDPKKRILENNFTVYSFFNYGQVDFLLKSKYCIIGSRIYSVLSKKASDYLKNTMDFEFNNTYSIGIDDRIKSYYSHTGIILNAFKNIFSPNFGVLTSKNNITYSGKSLSFRKNHKKDFFYKGKSDINAILIDDIITTGISIMQAKEVLEKNNINVLFALTLSDANNKT